MCLPWHQVLLLCRKVGSSWTSELAVVKVLLQACPLTHHRASANLVWPDCVGIGCSGLEGHERIPFCFHARCFGRCSR